MAGSFADYLEKKLLDHVFGATTYSAPATLYVGLFITTGPSDTGGGTEVSGGSYTRAVPANASGANNTTNWTNATGSGAGGSTKVNGQSITFPQATADWGTIIYAGIFDALTAGNLLAYGSLSTSKLIQNGDTAVFPASSITITLD